MVAELAISGSSAPVRTRAIEHEGRERSQGPGLPGEAREG
jgi:hypothetical protein